MWYCQLNRVSQVAQHVLSPPASVAHPNCRFNVARTLVRPGSDALHSNQPAGTDFQHCVANPRCCLFPVAARFVPLVVDAPMCSPVWFVEQISHDDVVDLAKAPRHDLPRCNQRSLRCRVVLSCAVAATLIRTIPRLAPSGNAPVHIVCPNFHIMHVK